MLQLTMELPHGAESFTFPNPRPSSPPTTPSTSRSRNTSAASYTSIPQNKRHAFVNLGVSPPENIEPKGLAHQFSYTPPDREPSPSDSSSSSDDVDTSDEAEPVPEFETHSDVPDRRPSVIRQIDEETDFTVEEISDNDIGYDDETEIVRPDQTEDAESEHGDTDASGQQQQDLLDALKNLQCGGPQEQEKAQEFEVAQREKYIKRRKRWSQGGLGKRSHAQSIGSDSSDNADIEPLDDIHQLGASARRLRRRTYGPVDGERPNRTSLILDNPPAEIEEFGFDAAIDIPPALISDSDDELSSDDDPSNEEQDLLVPNWLMEVDSNPSRPSTASTG